MASNTREEDSMDCDNCCESYDSETLHPMVLPCGHTFCGPCLKEIKTVDKLCPQCKYPFDVENLPKNFYVLKHIEKGYFQTNIEGLKTNLQKRLDDLNEERLSDLKKECEELVAIISDLDDDERQKEGKKKGNKYLKKMKKNIRHNVSHDIKTAFDLDISKPRDYLERIIKELKAGKKFYAFHEIEGKLKYGKLKYGKLQFSGNMLRIQCLTIDEIPKEEESYCVAFNDFKRCASAANDESLGLRCLPYLFLTTVSKGVKRSKSVFLCVHSLALNSAIRFIKLCSGELGPSLKGSQLIYNEADLPNTFTYTLKNPPATPKTVYDYNFSSNSRESVTANKGEWILLESGDKGFVVHQCQGDETFSRGLIGKNYKVTTNSFLDLSEDEKRQTWNITNTGLHFQIFIFINEP